MHIHHRYGKQTQKWQQAQGSDRGAYGYHSDKVCLAHMPFIKASPSAGAWNYPP